MKSAKHISSLRSQMTTMMLVAWLIPVVLVLVVMGWYISDSLSQRAAHSLADQFEVNVRMCADRLDSAVEASRLASYDPAIETAWDAYEEDGNYAALYRASKSFLDRQYRADGRFFFSALWFHEDPERMGLSTLTESATMFNRVRLFWNNDYAAASALAETLDTSVGFLSRDGELYLVRNLKDRNYRTIATLVLALNQPYYFESLTAQPWASSLTLTFNDDLQLLLKGDTALTAESLGLDKHHPAIQWDDRRCRALYEPIDGKGYHLSAAAGVNTDVLLSQFSGYKYLLFALTVLLIPLLLLVYRFFRRKISLPVQAMTDGAREIEAGQLGYQMTYRANSREFQYLTDSFNHMSGQLEYQFNRIYQEELALRDARIKALQSHINPHFLNNTLEIINWEARMNGDVKVSKMIEDLSTVLDAAIDRSKRPEVRLAEEMTYISAYLHIIDQRFGKRLSVTVDMPEALMDYMVPRLILQPVVENAVEHGIGPGGCGTITLRGRRDGNLLLLDTENDGGLSPEDERHVAELLAPDYDASRESSRNIGIANVNQRLRILYGEPSGLSITQNGAGKVLARITILIKN